MLCTAAGQRELGGLREQVALEQISAVWNSLKQFVGGPNCFKLALPDRSRGSSRGSDGKHVRRRLLARAPLPRPRLFTAVNGYSVTLYNRELITVGNS